MKQLFFGFLLTIVFSSAHAEFAPNNLRFISMYDFQNKLLPFFASVWYDPSNINVVSTCFGTPSNLGFNNPATGAPVALMPTAGTLQQLKNCVHDSTISLSGQFRRDGVDLNLAVQLAQQVLPDPLVGKYIFRINDPLWAVTHIFMGLPPQEKEMIVENLIEKTLGIQSVVLSYGLIPNVNQYRDFLIQQIQPGDTIIMAVGRMFEFLVVRDEFLTY